MLFLKTMNTQVRGFWEKLKAIDLGPGSIGVGAKYLADDMTWKTISSFGGTGTGLGVDLGDRIIGNSFIDMGSRT